MSSAMAGPPSAPRNAMVSGKSQAEWYEAPYRFYGDSGLD